MEKRSLKTCAPWCWLEKAALEKIRAESEDAKSVLLVYLALCEIASDELSDDFRASMLKIGGKCGLSRPTVLKHLNQLESIGLVEIIRSRTNDNFKMPSAYKLLCCESAAKDRRKRYASKANKAADTPDMALAAAMQYEQESKSSDDVKPIDSEL